MNLLHKYKTTPQSYLIVSGGGAGKTTILKHMERELLGDKLNGKTVIPIYINLASFNLKRLGAEPIVDEIRNYFGLSVSNRAVFQMFSDYVEKYLFLLLIDSFNEVRNYRLPDGQMVHDHIENDLSQLMEMENIHCIVTTREKGNIENEELKKKFTVATIKSLSNNKIAKYLGLPDLKIIPEHLRSLLCNPMALSLFKYIYDTERESALYIQSKYELLKMSFELDIQNRIQRNKTNNLVKARKYVIDEILPLLAFEEQCWHFGMRLRDAYFAEEALKCVLQKVNLPDNLDEELIQDALNDMAFINENGLFRHEMYREYFATNGIQLLMRNPDSNKQMIREFYIKLIESIGFVTVNDNYGLKNRSKNLDLAEFIYAYEKDRLPDTLMRCGIERVDSIKISEAFFRELAGIYDDLHVRKESAEIGWIALDLLNQIDDLTCDVRAERLNFLYYCVNNDNSKDAKHVIFEAKRVAECVPEEERSMNLHIAYGKILNNIGSDYYMKKMYDKAEPWRVASLEYRRKHGLTNWVWASYRAMMSDKYSLKQYREAYNVFKMAIQENSAKFGQTTSRFSMMNHEARKTIVANFIERAMGSEIYILMLEEESEELKREISEELGVQIPYVYKKATEGERVEIDTVANLKEKLKMLTNYEKLEKYDKRLPHVVKEYLHLCESHF